MRKRVGACLAIAFGLSSMPGLARAYTAAALARFQAGRQYQAAGQLRWAVLSYEAALTADPSLTACYKALGTIYYEAGDHRGALYFYDRYLATNPDDTATRNFDSGLRASLGAATPAQASVPATGVEGGSNSAQHPGGPFRPGFDVRLPVTGILASSADVDEFYGAYAPPPSGYTETDNEPGAALAWATGLGFDYGLSNGFVTGLDFLYGPNRHYSVANPVGFEGQNLWTETDTYSISQYSLLLTPGWRFKVGGHVVLEPRLGLGVMEASMVQGENIVVSPLGDEFFGVPSGGASPAGSYSATSSGLGYAVWPEIRGEYLFGQFGVGFSLGYLLNTPTAQKYTAVSGNPANAAAITGPNPVVPFPTVGAPVEYQSSPTSTSPTRWYLSTNGLTFGLFVTYHFQPLFW